MEVSREITAGYQSAPLILASVSRARYQVATEYPPLWSTIIIDQSDGDYLERIHLSLDRFGQELLDIILLDHATPTLRLNNFLVKYAHCFKTLVGLSARPAFHPSRMEPIEGPAGFTSWSEYKPTGHRVSTIPVPNIYVMSSCTN